MYFYLGLAIGNMTGQKTSGQEAKIPGGDQQSRAPAKCK